MAKSNVWDGFCSVCGVAVREGEGVVEGDQESRRGWVILCVEHMPAGRLDPPKPLEAAKLPSVHLDDRKYER